MKIIFSFFFLIISISSFSKEKSIRGGYWHTKFTLNETNVLPITFLFKNENTGLTLSILNADETIELKKVIRRNDSLFIPFPMFASELKAKIVSSNQIEGAWFNYSKKNNYNLTFVSNAGYSSRFPKKSSNINVFGKWEVTFDYDKTPEKALGVFHPATYSEGEIRQDIKGTFLTETGDYRFLEGVTSSDSLYLSTFDGSHAFLFKSKLVNDTLWGEFLSGSHYRSKWYAIRNESFELRDANSLTYLVNEDSVTFSLPDLNKETYNFPNEQTKGKVTLIQIMGTWCPNCLDESRYVIEQKKKYGDQLEIIAVTFETQKTLDEKINKVKTYKENLGLDYTFVIGGKASKASALTVFPMLNKVISFPTLIIIGKDGQVKKIHTGFSGPGTGEYYTEFVEETNSYLDKLIKE